MLTALLQLTLSIASAIQCPSGTRAAEDAASFQSWCANSANQKHGPIEVRYGKGGRLKSRGTYASGTPEGLYESWTDEGRPHERGSYKGGKLHGKWERYYEEGGIKDRAQWRDGVPVGKFELFHPNGKLKASGYYKDGERAGKWSEWDESGNVLASGAYECNQRSGEWTLRTGGGSVTQDYGRACGSGISWLNVRAESVTVFAEGSFALTTASLGLVPEIGLLSWLSLRPRLGAVLYKDQSGTFTPAGLGDLSLEFKPWRRLTIAIGGGVQYWSAGGIVPATTAVIALRNPIRSWRWLRAVTAGYTGVLSTSTPFSAATLGAEIAFLGGGA